MEENLKIPAHVALILDGNGRWAKKRGLPRQLGHKKGCETVEQIVEDAARLGIRYLTVYGFSTENWKRPAEEVGALMQLFRYYTKRLLKIAKANNVRVRMIGERSRFAPDIVEGIDSLERETKDNTGLTFVIAVNYGSRDEITRAVKKVMEDVKAGRITEEEPVCLLSGYCRDPGSGSSDPHQRGTASFQLPALAACLFGALCDRLPLAGFQQRGITGGHPPV